MKSENSKTENQFSGQVNQKNKYIKCNQNNKYHFIFDSELETCIYFYFLQ